MIQVGIIVFREALEIAIVVALLLAATRGVEGRIRWLLIGFLAGAAGAGIVALFAESITDALSGRGQDVFNAVVLLATVAMVAWTIAWMRSHARGIATETKATAERVLSGEAPRYLLAGAVAVCTLRDGSELVLFLTALQMSGELGAAAILAGFALGALGGTGVGTLIYFGVIGAALRSIFGTVTVLLAFLGAGLAAQAAGFLVAAGWLPALLDPVWDTSMLLDDESIPGQAAHALVGYVSQPSGVQVLFYALVLAGICRLGLRRPSPRPVSSAA